MSGSKEQINRIKGYHKKILAYISRIWYIVNVREIRIISHFGKSAYQGAFSAIRQGFNFYKTGRRTEKHCRMHACFQP